MIAKLAVKFKVHDAAASAGQAAGAATSSKRLAAVAICACHQVINCTNFNIKLVFVVVIYKR
jgi:hypothetical protein